MRKCVTEALATNVWRKRRHLTDSDTCPVCFAGEESIIHLLRDCRIMSQVWSILIDGNSHFRSFFLVDLHEWLWSNLNSSAALNGLSWSILFGTTISLARQAKNELVFQNQTTSAAQLVHKANYQANAILASIRDHKRIALSAGLSEYAINIKWDPPDTGWVKFNCDGSVINFGGQAAGGGVLRSDSGAFLFGYACGLGPCTIPEAELWAILRGLQAARNRGYDCIMIESDSLATVRLITLDCSPLHSCYNVVKDIRDILLHCEHQLSHIFGEANQVTDSFANHGHSLSSCNIFESLPAFASLAFKADGVGVLFPRGY